MVTARNGASPQNAPPPLIIADPGPKRAIVGVPTLWAWWRYFCASLRISSRGIAQITPFGRQFIPWAEVREYRERGQGTMVFGNVSPGSQVSVPLTG